MSQRGKDVLGRLGEDAACRYLEGIGHTVLERNWRSGHLEVDIISLAKDGIHIIEVKTRVAPLTHSPEENVGADKRRRLTRAALAYLHSARVPRDSELFFDIITVVLDGGRTDINYIPSAWIPMYV